MGLLGDILWELAESVVDDMIGSSKNIAKKTRNDSRVSNKKWNELNDNINRMEGLQNKIKKHDTQGILQDIGQK